MFQYGSALKSSNKWLLCLIIGIISCLYVNISVYVTMVELVALPIAAIFVITNQFKIQSNLMRWFIISIVLWLISVIFTDIYRGSDLNKIIRGFGTTVDILCGLIFVYTILRQNINLLKPIVIGQLVGTIVGLYAFRNGSDDLQIVTNGSLDLTFESHYIHSIINASLVVAIYLYGKHRVRAYMIIIIIGVLCIANGSRSAGGMLLVAVILCISSNKMHKVNEYGNVVQFRNFIKTVSMLIIGGSFVYYAYAISAVNGWLGDAIQTKYNIQTQGTLGIFMTSRLNVVGGLLAIRDSPIIGYGSRAVDVNEYMYQALMINNEYVTDDYRSALSQMSIPAHSMILQAWVEHGIIAVIFWCVFVYAIFKFITSEALYDANWALYNCIMLSLYIWALGFSPIAKPFDLAIFIAILIIWAEARGSVSAS